MTTLVDEIQHLRREVRHLRNMLLCQSQIASVVTNNATAATLVSIPIPLNQSIYLEPTVVAVDNQGHTFVTKLRVVAKNDANTLTIINQTTLYSYADTSLASATVTIQVSGTQLNIVVTGTSMTLQWQLVSQVVRS